MADQPSCVTLGSTAIRTFVRGANHNKGTVPVTAQGIKQVVILGAGFIGTSMAAVCAVHGWQVTLADPDTARRDAAADGIAAQTEAMALAGLRTGGSGTVATAASGDTACAGADLVLECGPEDLPVKRAIFADLLGRTGPDTVLATMSSAIPMSRIVPDPVDQVRCLVAHPVNPPAVLRLIELCPAPGTDRASVDRAAALFADVGFSAAVLSREIEGFILNRLQGAVLREAYRLVEDGITEPNDIDMVMRLGLGPRWALSGPFETAELNTPGGIPAHAARMGPAYKRMGEARGETVDWTPALVRRVAQARAQARAGTPIPERAAWRARAVARLVDLRDRLMRGQG